MPFYYKLSALYYEKGLLVSVKCATLKKRSVSLQETERRAHE